MTGTDLIWTSAHELAACIRRREISPVEAVQAALDQLDAVNPHINAFVTVTAETALEQARVAERCLRVDTTDLPSLYGVPMTVKDLCDTAGVRTTYGCVSYQNHVPTQDALTWQRLKNAGAILIGKTTTPEFGLLGVTESKLTGATATPWDPGRTAGGSSGGAAAAVAAGIAPLAWGSDGGGSIRVPSSCCGVVGFKASTGRLPHRGNTEPDATDGPLARRVVDVALMLDVTVGPHPEDRLTLPATADRYLETALKPLPLNGLRIAYSPDLNQGPIGSDTRACVERAVALLGDAGAFVEQIEMGLPDAIEFFARYWAPEYVEVVDMLIQRGEDVWPFMRRMAQRGCAMSGVEVSAAHGRLKTEIYRYFADVFSKYDVLLSPTTPVPPFPHCADKGGVDGVDGHPVENPMLHFHSLTELPSHAGLPAISVPCGFTPRGLPVGLQIIGPRHQDSLVISVAAAYEALAPWWHQRPLIAS